jgi:hypothetical protein
MNPTVAIKLERTDRKVAWRRRLGVAFLLVVLTSIATLPFFVIGEDQQVGCCGGEMPVTHDSWMHFNQMQAFYRGLAAGRIYPRWDDATHSGYGAPTTSFYPPGAYYITSAVYFLTRDWRWVWVGFYWLASFGSAAAIYRYARQTMARGASIVAAAVYVFAPYHLINQYQRGAMAEFLSFVWTPLLLLFAERLLGESSRQKAWLSAAGLATSFGAFLWSHPPAAYQFLLVFGSGFAVWAIKRGEWRKLLVVGFALLFGSMIAAAYFYPAMLEQHLVNADDVERTWPYHTSYVYDFGQTRYDHVNNPFFVRIDRIWAFNAVVILLASATLLIFKRSVEGRRSEYRLQPEWFGNRAFPPEGSTPNVVWLWAAAGGLAIFLMTKYSAPIGRLIPKIETGVFSWRMLMLASLAAALLAGAGAQTAIDAAVERRKLRLIWCASTAALIVAGAIAMSARQVAWPMWRGQSFAPNPEHYNYATLPRGAPRDVPQMDLAQLASGQGRLTINRWTPEQRELVVELEEPAQLQFRTFNFAGWTASVDGRKVEIKEGAVKNIVIDLPVGEHWVALEFRSTPVRRAGNWGTVLSFALLVSMILVAKRRK